MPVQEGARRILVVEADTSIGEVITDVLEDTGFAVQIAPTATAALEALGDQSPDAILVDLAQPDKQGWQLLHAVGSSPAARSCRLESYPQRWRRLLRREWRASGAMGGYPCRSSSTSCCRSWRT